MTPVTHLNTTDTSQTLNRKFWPQENSAAATLALPLVTGIGFAFRHSALQWSRQALTLEDAKEILRHANLPPLRHLQMLAAQGEACGATAACRVRPEESEEALGSNRIYLTVHIGP